MKQLATIATIVLMLWGCTGKEVLDELKPVPDTKVVGTLKVEISPSGKFSPINIAQKSKMPSAQDTGIEDGVDINLFTLVVKNEAGNIVKSWSKYADFQGEVTLNEGKYSVEASSPGTRSAAFENPIYQGEKSVIIEAQKVQPLNLMCTLTNMKVTVICSEVFKREINPDYTIIVANKSGILAFNDGEARAGFFDVDPLVVQLNGTRVADGEPITQTLNINSVAAKDHHIITLSTTETGSTAPGISIDYTTNNKDHGIIIPGEDEEGTVPEEDKGDGGDDGSGGGVTPPQTQMPTITGNGIGFPLTITNEQADADPIVDIKITTNKSGIAELWVTINSPELTPEVLGMLGIPSSFDLANLVEGSELEKTLKGLGLIGAEPVKGKTAFSVSIGSFMKFLSPGDTGTLDHMFEVKVKDGDANELNKTLTVRRTL